MAAQSNSRAASIFFSHGRVLQYDTITNNGISLYLQQPPQHCGEFCEFVGSFGIMDLPFYPTQLSSIVGYLKGHVRKY